MFRSRMARSGKRAVAAALVLVCCIAGQAGADEVAVSLDQARDYFLQHNFDVLMNQYEVKKAEADLEGAKLLPNPVLSVNYTGLDKTGLRAGDNTQYTYRVDQLIELGGKRGLRTGVASESLEAAKWSHEDAVRTLLAGFYTLFYNLSLDLLNVTLAQEELEQFDKTLDIAGKRYNAGFLSQVDYAKLKVARLDLESSLTTLENQYRNDIEQLRFLMGSPTRIVPSQAAIRDRFPEYSVEELISRAYEQRPDLRALQRQLKSEDYGVALARSAVIPDVTVGAEYENFGPQQKPGAGFGISLNIPLFNRNQGEIGRRKAEYRQTEFQIEKTRSQVESEVRIAYQNYTTALRVYESYRQKKTDVETLLTNSEKAFSLGGTTVLDLLDTRKTYNEFMTKYNQAMVQSNLNDELLKLYTGVLPWSD